MVLKSILMTVTVPGPEPRAIAVRGSLLEIAALPEAGSYPASEVPVAALVAALLVLGLPRADDAPVDASRRATCRQVADCLHTHTPSAWAAGGPAAALRDPEFLGLLTAALPWFHAQFRWLDSADPRLAAMAGRARREFHDLSTPPSVAG